jgi:hypothetical protein
MFGAYVILPLITSAGGAALALWMNGEPDVFWGAVIGFGVGCAILVFVWALFAALSRWAAR